MKTKMEKHSDYLLNYQAKKNQNSVYEAIIIVGIIAILAVMLGFLTMSIFTDDQMYIIRPILAAIAVFVAFSYILKIQVHTNLLGEIGFIYLSFALVYTIIPAIKFFALDFNFPLDFDGFNFAVLSPQPEELGIHFWRHVLFISSVAAGFLLVRGRSVQRSPLNEKSERRYDRVITILLALMICCFCVLILLSAPVTTYYEHYSRFDHLSWPLRRVVYLCLIVKSDGYFVLMALMFSQYRKYRIFIFIIVPIVCAYEVVFSLGSRIVAFTILLAFLGFYNFRVTPISLKKGIVSLVALVFLFSVIGILRLSTNTMEATQEVISNKTIKASEFESVYCTGFHLYFERSQGTLPSRDWKMFVYELRALIPFIDHTTYHPQYWYARNYFSDKALPPTTMGVIAESGIWGGEFDLFLRGLINGVIFALLTRWFMRRREKWWTLTIYIYCYAMCIMNIKYSLFYLLIPLSQIFAALLLTEVLFRLQKTLSFLKSLPSKQQHDFASHN